METDQRIWFSPVLGHDMALKVYGHAGRPVIAFPSQNGRWWDFEGWGMVESVGHLIDGGRNRLREARLAIVVGQGAWEDEMLADTRALDGILRAKGIPAIVDYWGHDVNHDGPVVAGDAAALPGATGRLANPVHY